MARVKYENGEVIVVDAGGEVQMVLNNAKLKREQLSQLLPRVGRGRRRMRWFRGSYLKPESVDTEIYYKRMDIA
ncbi:hypothetical protein KKA02_02035 [Patescibacteria group bacterium]|nr:hypothetical protein [Patescibacteria group bacterium]